MTDISPKELLQEQYIPGAIIVFLASSLAALVWYGIAAYFNDRDRRPEFKRFRIIWAGLSLLPFMSILLSLALFRESSQAIPFLAFFFVVDALILFWFATAISTPESLKYGIVPGSFYIRHLPGLK